MCSVVISCKSSDWLKTRPVTSLSANWHLADCQVSATPWGWKTWAGVFHPKHLRGRLLSKSTTFCKSSSLKDKKSKPFGKKKRSKPLVFSLVPRSHGACGFAKYIGAWISFSIYLNSANSEPLSSERLQTFLFFSAEIRLFFVSSAVLFFNNAAQRYRLFLSTKVTINPFPTAPQTVSPSQSPIRFLFWIFLGLSD